VQCLKHVPWQLVADVAGLAGPSRVIISIETTHNTCYICYTPVMNEIFGGIHMAKGDILALTHAEAVENRRKGGIASGVARNKRRLMREVINEILPMRVTDEKLAEHLESAGLPATNETAIALAAITKAAHDDIEAARFLRDTRGEKPTDQLAVGNFFDAGYSVRDLDLSQFSTEQLQAMVAELSENNI